MGKGTVQVLHHRARFSELCFVTLVSCCPGPGLVGATWLFYRQAKKARVQATLVLFDLLLGGMVGLAGPFLFIHLFVQSLNIPIGQSNSTAYSSFYIIGLL